MKNVKFLLLATFLSSLTSALHWWSLDSGVEAGNCAALRVDDSTNVVLCKFGTVRKVPPRPRQKSARGMKEAKLAVTGVGGVGGRGRVSSSRE